MIDPGDQNVHGSPAQHCPETLDMFSPPRARATDPETSHEAAESMAGAAGAQRAACLKHLRTVGPAIADEIDAAMGWRPTTAGRRLSELAEAKLAKITDQKRRTRSNRNAFVWEAL